MKITAFVLLLLILTSSLLYYGYFDVMLLQSKEKAMHSIAAAAYDHSLRLYKIPASQKDAYSDDEVTINGNLYDVGEREIINDTLYITLYHDTDEQNVLSLITDFFKTDDGTSVSSFPNRPALKNIRIIYNPQYYFDALSFSLQCYSKCYSGFINNTALNSLPYYDIIVPPPQLS
jgi:hypothetical protein